MPRYKFHLANGKSAGAPSPLSAGIVEREMTKAETNFGAEPGAANTEGTITTNE